MTNFRLARCDDDHMGHFIFNYMKKIPNEICQIDVATGEQRTCATVLSRSIRLAQCFRRLGLVPGDIIVVAGTNHLDAHIPFYAAMMSGQPIAGIDPTLKKSEIKHLLNIVVPKIAFCNYEDYEEYKQAVQELEFDTRIVTFGGDEFSFTKLMNAYEDLPPEEEFRERRPALNLSTLHWISGSYNAMLMPINHIMLQSSVPVTTDFAIDIINKYKPAGLMCSPNFVSPVLHNKKYCDLKCFDIIKMAGSKIHVELLTSLRARVREDTIIHQGYGQTEVGIVIMDTITDKPYGNVGPLDPKFEGKLLSTETGKEILESNVPGELLLKGPSMAGYYKDPKATKEAYTEDGYLKTGDIFYKDENGLYYFVERLKMLLKYRNYQIVPPEVEEVILTHPGVVDVCVTAVPHPDDGDHLVACVVRQEGSCVTAQEIKDHVLKTLSNAKRLRGGVVFLDNLPTTSNGKIARLEVKKFVISAKRE